MTFALAEAERNIKTAVAQTKNKIIPKGIFLFGHKPLKYVLYAGANWARASSPRALWAGSPAQSARHLRQMPQKPSNSPHPYHPIKI
jgi:hypothetical protein